MGVMSDYEIVFQAGRAKAVKAKSPLPAHPPLPEGDKVVLPAHYTRFKIEPVHFITENGLDFMTGNVVKYVLRAPHKNGIEDLRKAARYLDMMIKRAEGNPDWSK